MGIPGSTPEVSEQDALGVFSQSAQPYSRFTTGEIAEALDCSPGAAQATLEGLVEQGRLASKAVVDSTHLWWPADLAELYEGKRQRQFMPEQFGAFINAVEDYAIFLLAPDGTVVTWNDGAERIKGYTKSEIVGEHFSTFYTEEDVDDGVPDRNLEAATDVGAVEDEGWRVRKDGSRFWANVTITAIRGDDGALQGFTKVTRDMTERREYERQLQAQTARLERQRDDLKQELDEVFERVDDAFYALDDEFRFTYINDTAEAYFENPAGALLGRNIWEVLEVDGDDPIIEQFETAMADQEPVGFERYSDPMGIWATVRIYPSETGLSVYFRDITERKERERELERIQDRMEFALNSTGAIVWDWNVEDDRASFYPSEEPLYGTTVEDWEDFIEVIHPEDRQKVQDGIERALETGEPKYEEIRIVRDGEVRWIEAPGQPIQGEGDEPTRMIGVVRDITERKRADSERRESEERFRRLMEHAPLSIQIFDEVGRSIDANPAWERLWDASREHLDDYNILKDEQLEDAGLLPHIRDAFAGEVVTLPVVHYDPAEIGKPGRDRWIEGYAYPLLPGEGESFEVALVHHDVTERKEREQELERYEIAVETVWDGITILDADERFVLVNEAFCELSGYDREEVLGEHATLILDESTYERAGELHEAVVEGARDIATLEYDLLTDDGGSVPVEARFGPAEYADGSVGGAGVIRDISERQERERTLERYETLIQESADVNAILGRDGTLEYVTPSVRYVLGYNAEDLIGDTAFEYLHHDDIEETRALFGALVEGDRDTPKAEFRFRAADGSWVWLEAHGRNLLDDPDIDGLVVYTRDVTDRKRYEVRLSETVDKLEESNERLEQFAYIASHDLQEPLRMVSSYLQLLEGQYCDELDGDAREYIEYAVDGADRMREMIEDLLAYARVDTRAEPLEPTDCESVVDRILTTLQVQIEESGAKVEVEALPTVAADENQLDQVFQNLVSNAIKYRGAEPPKIEIGAERKGDEWVFEVADTGIGFDPEHGERIFEVFKRLHTHEEYPGTGIGLALCKKIIDRHGGRIWAESEPGEGATVRFTLPSASENAS